MDEGDYSDSEDSFYSWTNQKNLIYILLQQSFPIQSSSKIYLRLRLELGSLYFPPFLPDDTLDFIRIYEHTCFF